MFIFHRLIDAEQSPVVSNPLPEFGWKQYHNLSTIYNWLDKMLLKYPNVLSNCNYGKSYEGRPLRAITVSHKKVANVQMNQTTAFT